MPTKETRARWKSLGNAMRAVANLGSRYQESRTRADNALKEVHKRCGVEKAALAEYSGATGGFLVPEELMLGVDGLLDERGLLLKHCWVVDMVSAQMDIPNVDRTVAAATGTSPLWGGVVFSWTTMEGSALTETEPSFSQNKLVARNLLGIAVVSNQLVQDGGASLGAYLEMLFAHALLWTVEYACFQGNGVNAPLGIVNAPGTKQVTRSGPGSVSGADLSGMSAALVPASYPNALWACSPTALEKISQLSEYKLNMALSIEEPIHGYLFGRPLYVTEKLPAVGTLGDVVLFDPTMYAIGRRWMEVSASDQVPGYMQKNQTVYRLWWRGDGQPLVRGLMNLADGSTTAGCYVALK